MESAALFIVANYLRVRCGAAFLALGNQERAKRGMDNPLIYDTDMGCESRNPGDPAADPGRPPKISI